MTIETQENIAQIIDSKSSASNYFIWQNITQPTPPPVGFTAIYFDMNGIPNTLNTTAGIQEMFTNMSTIDGGTF